MAMTIDSKTWQDVLRFGILSMSVSEHSDIPMHAVVDDYLSNGVPTHARTVMTDVMRSAGVNESVEFALLGLKYVLLGETATIEDAERFKWKELGITYAILAVTVILLFLRLCSRRVLKGRLEWDDFALVVGCAGVLAQVMSQHVALVVDEIPVCNHVWNISWESYKKNVKLLWESEIVFCLSAFATKMAIMSFYWSIIPRETTHLRYYHRVIFGSGAAIVAMGITQTSIAAFQCKPIGYWRDPLHVKCIPGYIPFAVITAGVSSMNVICLLLPVDIAWRLRLTLKQKLMVTGLFGFGILAEAACVYRTVVLHSMLYYPDWTYYQCYISVPATLENALTLHAACLPAVKALLCSDYVPKLTRRAKRKLSRKSETSTTRSGIVEMADGQVGEALPALRASGSVKDMNVSRESSESSKEGDFPEEKVKDQKGGGVEAMA